MSCKSCPINITTPEGEYANETGCLPCYGDALKWFEDTGKVWACHSNPKKACSGFLKRTRHYGVDVRVTSETILITESMTLEQIYQQ